jgi:hypothetical protein
VIIQIFSYKFLIKVIRSIVELNSLLSSICIELSSKPCKTELPLSFHSSGQPSTYHLVNAPHASPPTYPPLYSQQYYHHPSSVIQHESSVAQGSTVHGDHNDVTSTTTTVVLNPLQTVASVISPKIKPEMKGIAHIRRQSTPHSPTCSSTNQAYLVSQQHAMQASSCHLQSSPSLGTIRYWNNDRIQQMRYIDE